MYTPSIYMRLGSGTLPTLSGTLEGGGVRGHCLPTAKLPPPIFRDVPLSSFLSLFYHWGWNIGASRAGKSWEKGMVHYIMKEKVSLAEGIYSVPECPL